MDCTSALKFGEDISSASWFTPLFEDAGVSLDILPDIVECGSEIGEARGELAENMQLSGARLFHGMTDGNASAIATGCIRPGDFGIGCGTTTVPKYVCEEIKAHPAIYYHKHPVQGYLAGAASSTCGMLEWLSDKVFGIPMEESFSLAEKIEPGSEYTYFPQGDRSPFDDPSMGAALIGLWLEDSQRDEVRGRIFRSGVVGITFLEYYYISLFEGLFGRRIDEVKLAGGATRSHLWNKLRASIYGRPVKVLEKQVAIGALIPVALKLGLYRDPDEATDTLLRVIERIEPDPVLGARYQTDRDLFMNRWKVLQEMYHL
jgi:xylulokinase